MRGASTLPRIALAAALMAPAGCAPPQAGTTAAAPAARPGRAAPADAETLLQADAASVVEALGVPDLRRSEGAAEMWLYARAPGCRLDLVLFRDGPVMRVAHAKAHAAAPESEAACLGRIAGGR